jgi:hypothetical protein
MATDAAPLTSENEPGGHASQLDAPSVSPKVPGGQKCKCKGDSKSSCERPDAGALKPAWAGTGMMVMTFSVTHSTVGCTLATTEASRGTGRAIAGAARPLVRSGGTRLASCGRGGARFAGGGAYRACLRIRATETAFKVSAATVEPVSHLAFVKQPRHTRTGPQPGQVSAGRTLQFIEPECSAYQPAVHCLHALRDCAAHKLEAVPAGQAWHALRPSAPFQ